MQQIEENKRRKEQERKQREEQERLDEERAMKAQEEMKKRHEEEERIRKEKQEKLRLENEASLKLKKEAEMKAKAAATQPSTQTFDKPPLFPSMLQPNNTMPAYTAQAQPAPLMPMQGVRQVGLTPAEQTMPLGSPGLNQPPIYQQYQMQQQQAQKIEENEQLNKIRMQLQQELEMVQREADQAVRERDRAKQTLEGLIQELNRKMEDEEKYRDKLQRAMERTKPLEKVESSRTGPIRIFGIKGNSEYYDEIAESIALECQTKFVPYESKVAQQISDEKLLGLLDDGSDIFKEIARKSYGKFLVNSQAAGLIKTSKAMLSPTGTADPNDSDVDHAKVFGDIEKIMNEYYQEKLNKGKI